MEKIEFTNVEHARLSAAGYKFIEIIATGREVETSEDYYRKEVIFRAHKTQPPPGDHYIISIDEDEIREAVQGSDTDIFYVERA